jgi:alginate O-acetyltransferase complex protein AlgI
MLFNSLDFAIFLPIVFVLYWFVTNKKLWLQNSMLLLLSYIFYGWWDWRFLFLLLFSTLLDYFSGIKIYESKNSVKRKFWLVLTIGINLGFLGFFKYYNFFAVEFAGMLQQFGFKVNEFSFKIIQIILPVGISFYTFHGLSYIVDNYKKRITALYNFVNYALFVSCFPSLITGNQIKQFSTELFFVELFPVNLLSRTSAKLPKKPLKLCWFSQYIERKEA